MIAERPHAFNRRLTAIKACANISSVPMRTDNRDPEIVDDDMAAVFRGKTPVERLRVAFGLWTSTRNMVERLLRSQYPDWDDRAVRAEVSRRMSHGTG